MITDRRPVIERILRNALVCRLALSVDDRPYIVPLNFGYERDALFFHGLRPEGKCLGMIRRNPHVCFEIDTDVEPVPAEEACRWSMRYRSVVGFGTAKIVQDTAERRHALGVILRQFTDRSFDAPDAVVAVTAVVRVDIESMTAKEAGYAEG